MSYNGSGTFNINSAGQPVVTGTVITSTAFNALTADLATGLSTALTKDGQTTPTANIPMGTYKITGLGAGTVATDAVRLSQLQSGGTTSIITVSGTDTITGTVTPALTAYATGQQFSFVVAATNTTAVTLNVDGVGAKAVTRTGSVALVAGDMIIGQVVIVEYDGTRFQLINSNNLKSCQGLNYDGFKNRIINGAMVIDQRNAGASVTATSTAAFTYTLDRFSYRVSAASKFTVQQNAGSVTPPTGFINYLGVTSSSAYSVSASDFFAISQLIEGLNIADFAWGTANAVPITLSFKVYSSLTGTFGGSIANNGFARCYPFSYTISSANTWTSISITIPGDTSGTWLTTNGIGLNVLFGLGIGSTYSGTAGAWVGSQVLAPTGAVSVVGTNAATWYVTGVQLEKGSTATSFDYRPYGTELALCQRYYEPIGNFVGRATAATGAEGSISLLVTKRAAPTMTVINGTSTLLEVAVAARSFTTIASSNVQVNGGYISLSGSTGLTSPNLCTFYNNAAILAASSEL